MTKFNIRDWQKSHNINTSWFGIISEADTIKYKDKEGEAKEMDVDAAKKQPDDHPAKQAWLATQKGDGEKSEPKGADLFKTQEPGSEDDSSEDKSEEMFDEREDAVYDIIGALESGESPSDVIEKNSEALLSDPEDAVFGITQNIIDNGQKVTPEQIQDVNNSLEKIGIKDKVDFENIARELDYEFSEAISKTGKTVLNRRIK
tara:strand:- start:742 stop:1350 length:609 start_codon:yes stop_codon:yes gene_type:complete